ncbi:MAG: hypothetical protein ABEN55_10910 [Bradymonadaceae bacterium]
MSTNPRDVIDDMFTDESPLESLDEAIDKQAAQTTPGTKADGFSDVWRDIVKTACEHDWTTASRRAELIDIDTSGRTTPYEEGQMKAASMASEIDTPEAAGLYEFVQDAYKEASSQEDLQSIAKEASDTYDGGDLDRKEFGYMVASKWVADEGQPLEKVAWKGPMLFYEAERKGDLF